MASDSVMAVLVDATCTECIVKESHWILGFGVKMRLDSLPFYQEKGAGTIHGV
jgi:hypothetical protein